MARVSFIWGAGPVVAMAVAGARAHPDPSHTIEMITAQITAGDRRPPLFYARGVEHRALGQSAEAAGDFRECLQQDPQFLPARKDLSILLMEQGRLDEAAELARETIQLAAGRSPAVLASCWMIAARIELARKEFAAGLAGTGEALRLVPRGELDWFLLRAEAHRGLGRLDEAIGDLKAGFDASGSSVLRDAWVDALIDGGRGDEALSTIESEMAQCRYKSAWLIRRARVAMGAGRAAAARTDLQAALAELDHHILPAEPDPMLLIERGMALALLGDKEQAARELGRVREITTEEEVVGRLAKLVEPSSAPAVGAAR